MTMITPSYLGETIEYSSLHACRSTLEDPTPVQIVPFRLANSDSFHPSTVVKGKFLLGPQGNRDSRKPLHSKLPPTCDSLTADDLLHAGVLLFRSRPASP